MPFDWTQPCFYVTFSALAPFILVIVYSIQHVPHPKLISLPINFLRLQVRHFLTLSEAEAYERSSEWDGRTGEAPKKIHSCLNFVQSTIAFLQLAIWVIVSLHLFLTKKPMLYACLFSFSWLYTSFYSTISPKQAASFSLLAFYFIEFFGSMLVIGDTFFNSGHSGRPSHLDTVLAAYLMNAFTSFSLMIITMTRPLEFSHGHMNEDNVSPEDYTSLWQWMSFSWVSPFIQKGTFNNLVEEDVWHLSATMAARPLFLKFSEMKGRSLFRRLWAVVSRDLILDCVLNLASVFLKYLQPLFLKGIIDSFEVESPEGHRRAYFYACLMFCTQVIKAEADVQHSWCGRHAEARVRTVLMAAIYDKALKRKDFPALPNKDDDNSRGRESSTASNGKPGADVGKIVNLMSGDATRVAQIPSSMYFIYGCPIDVMVAGILLYRLLGTSAFAGLLVLLLGWPINSILSRQAIKISRESLATRDKRMSILSEMISSIKFIKFLAWEDRWIDRVIVTRHKELQWLVKSRINDILFQILWATMPVLISTIAFLVFVGQGNELTIGTAFTAITLFSMIRPPMNIIPTFIVQILQTRIALHRIESFLDEDEFDEQLSPVKHAQPGAYAPSFAGFGLGNASFKWNAVEIRNKVDKGKANWGGQADDGLATHVTSIGVSTTYQGVSADRNFELKDISVHFPEAELTVITGPTASGKTALLLALLGEMTLISGQVKMYKEPVKVDEYGLTHSVSYAAQTPWLQHQTIKENILFGNPYNEERYKCVLACCALLPDLDVLEDGDETEIGARGVSLSGGQKARVALARAVYASSKYILLDDPLSAVDSYTSRFLYEQLLLGPLMAHRTVVLVTHHIQLVLPATHYLVRMLDGRIQYQGTVRNLQEKGLLSHIVSTVSVVKQDEKVESTPQCSTSEELLADVEEREAQIADETSKGQGKKPRKLVEDENREVGSVKWTIYRTYLKASSYWTWLVLCFFVIFIQFLAFGEKYWMKIWAEAYGNSTISAHVYGANFAIFKRSYTSQDVILVQENTQAVLALKLPSAQKRPFFYVFMYALVGLAGVVMNTLSVLTQYAGALRASRHLFKELLRNVVHATMRWYDVTPVGRVLNRFSKDIETVDVTLASSLQSVNVSLAVFFSSVIIVIIVFPSFIIPALAMGFCYFRLAVAYLNTGRDLKRMESTSRSPLFTGFAELLGGIVTVRAFSAEPRFLADFFKRIDLTQRMWYFFWMTNRWLLLRLDVLGALAIFITTLLSLSTDPSSRKGWAGWAALSITSAMSFTFNIYWACRHWTQLELDLNSVERVVEYLDLPQEPPAVIENSRPPAHWPTSTGPNSDSLLIVEDLLVQYAPDLPAVLHNISFSLKAKERVGLLGRTGSGKSTLAMSILRFVDPAKGRIIIDGIDISMIGIHDLRSRLTFIPQDATLFSGTLRDNLDPFSDYSDTECLDALRRVHFISDTSYTQRRPSGRVSRASYIHEREHEDATTVATSSKTPIISATSSLVGLGHDGKCSNVRRRITLDMDVSAGGLNFSAGQRQLIAMARALLRQNAMIILDEATSSIDFETDTKIQKTIREEFHNSLLLTIAHRLKTVIDYDRLIVLDTGRIAEFDTPYNLIRKEEGIFRGMCLKSGNFVELEKAAKAKAEQSMRATNVSR